MFTDFIEYVHYALVAWNTSIMAATILREEDLSKSNISNKDGKAKPTAATATIIQGEDDEDWPAAVVVHKDDKPKSEQTSNQRRKSRSKL